MFSIAFCFVVICHGGHVSGLIVARIYTEQVPLHPMWKRICKLLVVVSGLTQWPSSTAAAAVGLSLSIHLALSQLTLKKLL